MQGCCKNWDSHKLGVKSCHNNGQIQCCKGLYVHLMVATNYWLHLSGCSFLMVTSYFEAVVRYWT